MAPSGGRGGWARCSRAGAYSAEWTTNAERTAALQRFLDRYNYHRPHTALRGSPPVSRTPAGVANLAASSS